MGIPSYFSYIVKNHGNIIKMLHNLKDINNFYLDSNSIIYDCLRLYSSEYDIQKNDAFEDTLIHAICKKIDGYLDIVKPNNTIYIAFDGVAPVAKLEQQRNRRYKSKLLQMIEKKLSEETDHTHQEWDRTAITPGTNFMKKMGQYVIDYYKNKESTYGVKEIIVSTADDPGEGEHKLFAHIRKHTSKHATNLIYGLDADLIMLCLNHVSISKQIYLFRETPEFIKSIDASLQPNQAYYLDIPTLADAIVSEMNNYKKANCKQQINRLYDYIFLCFFMGNDFMPHFPAINIRTGGIHTIVAAYQHTIGNTNMNLTDGHHIYWNNVRKVVDYLAQNEHQYLLEQYKIRARWEKRNYPNQTLMEKMKKLDNIPTKERTIETLIDPTTPYWQLRYYKHLFGIDINKHYIREICMNYLEGLEWVMRYYTTGCPDWRWRYKYHYPPLLKDLVYFIPNWETRMISNNHHIPVRPLTQLSYVLPYASLHLLPKEVQQKLLAAYPSNYRMDFKIHWSFCKYFWESHVDFPEINIDHIQNILYLG